MSFTYMDCTAANGARRRCEVHREPPSICRWKCPISSNRSCAL
jgi:hypothetical protein